jgi:hypothetical protein
MIPFLLVDRNWYHRYWLDESSGSVQAPPLRALIGIAGKRILRMFRPMRNDGNASARLIYEHGGHCAAEGE